MRRIAIVCPLIAGADGQRASEGRFVGALARGVALASGGEREVDMITVGPEPGSEFLAPGLRRIALEPANRALNLADLVSWELPGLLAAADLVHVHQTRTRLGEVAVLLARQLRKPVCATDEALNTSPIGPQYNLAELIAARVVASDHAAARIDDRRVPIHVVKGWVDAERFSPADGPRSEILRVAPNATDPVPFDADALLQALAIVVPPVSGSDRAPGEPPVFALLDAMAAGVVPLVPRSGALAEFVEDGASGFLVDRPDEIAARLERLAREPGLAERLGREARRRVVRDFDLRTAGSRLNSLHDRLIDAARFEEAA